MRWLAILLVVACGRGEAHRDAAVLGEDPSRRLTDTECATAIDHAIDLADQDTAAQLRDGRDAHIASCVANGTLRDFRCLMSAQAMSDLGRCRAP